MCSTVVSRPPLLSSLEWLPYWPNPARHLRRSLAPGCFVFTQVEYGNTGIDTLSLKQTTQQKYTLSKCNDCLHYIMLLLCFFLFWIFLSPGYDIFERQSAKDSLISVPDVASGSGTPPLRLGCFYMLVFVPITCALLQLVAWSRFTLHGRKLQGIKNMRQSTQHGHLIDVKAIWTV